jgi:hypothetical protein
MINRAMTLVRFERQPGLNHTPTTTGGTRRRRHQFAGATQIHRGRPDVGVEDELSRRESTCAPTAPAEEADLGT